MEERNKKKYFIIVLYNLLYFFICEKKQIQNYNNYLKFYCREVKENLHNDGFPDIFWMF